MNITKHSKFIFSLVLLFFIGCKSIPQNQSPPPMNKPPSASLPTTMPSSSTSASPSSKKATVSNADNSKSQSARNKQSQSADKEGNKSADEAISTSQTHANTASSDEMSKTSSTDQGELENQEESDEHSPYANNSDNAKENEQVTGEQADNPSDEIDFSEEAISNSSTSTSANNSSATASSVQSSAQETDSTQSTQAILVEKASQQQSVSSQQQNTRQSERGLVGAKTSNEQIAVLEGQLARSMGDFDGMILIEREYVQNRANEAGSEQDLEADRGETGPLYDDVLNGAQDSSAHASNTPSGLPTATGAGTMPDVGSEQRQGEFGHKQASYQVPADIPSGNDDDVVARQIREAALKESDPVLREKLWQEYRNYKKQTKN